MNDSFNNSKSCQLSFLMEQTRFVKCLHMRALRGDEHLTFEKGKCQCWNQMLLQRVSRKRIFGKIGAERKTKVANKNSAFSFKGTDIQKNKCRILLTAFGGKATDNFIE